MRYGLRTFGDIVRAIQEQLKIQSTDTETLSRIKRNINSVYLQHVVPASNWEWLNASLSVTNEPYFEGGSASVQQNLVRVELTQAPNTSKVGYYFTVNNSNEVYRIATHAAGSNILTLEVPFTGTTNAAAKYKIWTDRIPLPADCMTVTEVMSTGATQPLHPVSQQQFRKHQVSGGARIGSPSFYFQGPAVAPEPYSSIPSLPQVIGRSSRGLVKTIELAAEAAGFLEVGSKIRVLSPNAYQYEGDFTVTSVSGNTFSYTGRVPLNDTAADDALVVLQESNQNLGPAPSLYIFPAIQEKNRRITMLVDYTSYASELLADKDEPLIPFEWRKVLFEGGMWLSCDRNTDAERAETFRQLMEQTLSRMLLKTENVQKTPTMRLSNSYLSSKRGWRKALGSYADGFSMSGGGAISAAPVATGTPGTVAVFDDAGYLIGSDTIDLSMLEYLIGNEGGKEANLPTNEDTVVSEYDATTYKSLQFQYQITRDGKYRSGTVFVNTNGSVTTHADKGAMEIGDVGVVFDTDIFAGQMRVIAKVDSSGATALIKYKASLL